MCADLSWTNRTLLVCDRSSFLDHKNRVSSQVEQLHFTYKVSLLLPGCSSTPSYLDSVLKSFTSFYLIRKLPIYELLDKDFLKRAVYQGAVYGLSFRTRMDEDNCVALMPNGHLVLSLDKDSFEVLGFEGKPSRFNHRWVVSVDLTDRSMAPGGRGYLKLLTGLKSRLQLQTDFLLSHHPGGGASLQPLLSRYDWSEHKPEVSRRCLNDLTCPSPRSCDPHSLLEWLGAVDADVSSENSSSSFLSSLVCPEADSRLRHALSVCVSGLLLPDHLLRLIQELRYHLQQPQLESWVSLTVHGFTDSPVSWGDGQQRVSNGGHTFYSLMMFHDHTYHLYRSPGTPHTGPP
ncbi:ribonuclease P protein subunit p40 [Austrofundulus limnaeus]|uniref:Ribonuclease P protein subunit p40 n=1 Tax=Austrofundulus limnaeus TaxID=52670 RepID=A0A2I4D7H4_AUSLI|nr:PREDICTED: ribonuclease P protein subunit p40 [Austrofundulus limnaeus]